MFHCDSNGLAGGSDTTDLCHSSESQGLRGHILAKAKEGARRALPRGALFFIIVRSCHVWSRVCEAVWTSLLSCTTGGGRGWLTSTGGA
jgi:hypothetical protein